MENEKEGEGRNGREKNDDRDKYLVTASLERLHQKRGRVFYHFLESEQVWSLDIVQRDVTQDAE